MWPRESAIEAGPVARHLLIAAEYRGNLLKGIRDPVAAIVRLHKD
jgi:hypothetical protein